MSRTRTALKRLVFGGMLLVPLGCDADGDGPLEPSTSTSDAASSSSSSNASETTASTSSTSSETGTSSSTSSGGSSSTSTGEVDPVAACRSAEPDFCFAETDALPEPQDCVPVDVYVYASAGECNDDFERRCEVLASSIGGGQRTCSFEGYTTGWFRELEDGRVEFWGVHPGGHNPPVEPGFTRCLDQPEMCACECELPQPE